MKMKHALLQREQSKLLFQEQLSKIKSDTTLVKLSRFLLTYCIISCATVISPAEMMMPLGPGSTFDLYLLLPDTTAKVQQKQLNKPDHDTVKTQRRFALGDAALTEKNTPLLPQKMGRP